MARARSAVAEAAVIVATVLGIYLYISLGSYEPGDMEADASIANMGGKLGAQIAHALLFVFGRSAFFGVAVAIYAVWIYIRMLGDEEHGLASFLSSMFGLLLLLFTASGIEALRIYGGYESLPGELSGGMLGHTFAKTLYEVFGFHGASVIMVGFWMAGLSMFALFSWTEACDRLGSWTGMLWGRYGDKTVAFLKNVVGLGEPGGDEAQIVAPRRPRRVAKPRTDPKMGKPTTGEQVKNGAADGPSMSSPRPKGATKKRKAKEREAAAKDVGEHAPPPLDLLATATKSVTSMSDQELNQLATTIEQKLAEFGVEAKVVEIHPGPVVTRYEIKPATGVKGSQVINLVRDLSRALTVSSIRVLETIAGKTTMGLEVPNAERVTVSLQEVINSPKYMASQSPLSLALGKDISGEVFVADLADMPHLLVAGTTGSGKSVQINSMILSILYKCSPDEVRLILIDPKVVELAPFDGLPHLMSPVITDMNLVPTVLSWLNALAAKGATDPETGEPLETLPLVVVVVDELADLMAVAGKKVEQLISRLAQKARAAGIHLILATQRPSVDVITGLIKANVPSRIAFQVSSRIDSRTILDQGGAETLLGKGDMLYLPTGSPEPIRIHGAFVSDEEVRGVTDHIRETCPETEKVDFTAQAPATSGGGTPNGEPGEKDPLYDQAVEVVVSNNRISISLVQRHLRIGYNRAARLIEDMERNGLISPMDAAGNRRVLGKGEDGG